jgi:mannose-1-phosphate guanylyltransferase
MEPVARGQGSAHVVAVGLDVEWMDVGSFAALHEVLSAHGRADELGNVCQGQVVQLDAQGNLLLNNADDATVLAVIGLHDMVVVRTATATLVAPLAASQQVKQVVEQVAETIDPALA